jgi:hypothetical protein
MTSGARTIAYHNPVASSFGERFEATTMSRQLRIGIGSRSFHFAMQSTRLHRSSAPARPAAGSALWRAMGYVGCASLALGVVFVSGSMLRASPPVEAYAVVMPIEAKAALVAPLHKAKPRPAVRAKAITPFVPIVTASDDWSVAPPSDLNGADPGLARPDADVATLPTVNGERAVAVYGATRIVDGKACRDVTVFVRDVDGKVSASPSTACKAR